jgi:hypothetical protein
MTTKEGFHFKRNKGVDVYTHTWNMINTMIDNMRHGKHYNFENTIHTIMRSPVWKQLTCEEQEEVAKKIPAGYVNIAKLIYKSLEFKKIVNKEKIQKRLRPSYTY